MKRLITFFLSILLIGSLGIANAQDATDLGGPLPAGVYVVGAKKGIIYIKKWNGKTGNDSVFTQLYSNNNVLLTAPLDKITAATIHKGYLYFVSSLGATNSPDAGPSNNFVVYKCGQSACANKIKRLLSSNKNYALSSITASDDKLYFSYTYKDTTNNEYASDIYIWSIEDNILFTLSSADKKINDLIYWNNKLYIFGDFTKIIDNNKKPHPANSIITFDPNAATLKEQWQALPGAPWLMSTNKVTAAAVMNGKLYLGGKFVTTNGTFTTISFDPTNSSWSLLSSDSIPVSVTPITTMTATPDNRFYIGGSSHFIEWDQQNRAWQQLGTVSWKEDNQQRPAQITSMALTDDNKLIVGGNFSQVGKDKDNLKPVTSIALWDPQTGWKSLGDPGLDFVYAIVNVPESISEQVQNNSSIWHRIYSAILNIWHGKKA